MANKLILKRSSVASKVPLATDLEPGELAVNLADQKLYSKKSDGTVILVGSGLGGSGDVQGPSSAADNAIARFDGTTGKIIQNSGVYVDDNGNVGAGTNAPTSKVDAYVATGNNYATVRSGASGVNVGTRLKQAASDFYQLVNDSYWQIYDALVDATRISLDKVYGSLGIGVVNPAQYASNSRVLNLTGHNANNGSANLFLGGSATTPGRGYAATEIFSITNVAASQEITRVTGTGTNGFRAYIKVTVTGHTGGIGNGINIKEWFWDGGTTGATEISSYTNGFVPALSVTNSTNHVFIINLASSNGTNGFNGVMKVEWMIPVDFFASTYTIS